MLEAEFGTARRFNQQVEEQVRGRCRSGCCCRTSVQKVCCCCNSARFVAVAATAAGAAAAAVAAAAAAVLPRLLLRLLLIGCCLALNLQVRKDIALPMGDEEWPLSLASFKL